MRTTRVLAGLLLLPAAVLTTPVTAAASSPQDAVTALLREPGGGLLVPVAGNRRSFFLRAVDRTGAAVEGVMLVGRVVEGPNAPTADSAGSPVDCTPTGEDGSASCGFTPRQGGTDRVRVHVDRTAGTPGVVDADEPFLDARFTTEASANTIATEARTIVMDPESTEFSSRADTARAYTATVRDRTGRTVRGVAVEFTEQGPGALDGGAESITRTTDETGRAQVVAGSRGEEGTQAITGRITTSSTECDRAADDPSGAPAGACTDTSTVTYGPGPGPQPPAPDPTPTPHGDCASGEPLDTDRSVIVAGDEVGVTVFSTPDTAVELRGYVRPQTSPGVLRSLTTGPDGVARTTLRPLGNTRVEARQRVEDCAHPISSRPSTVIAVRTRLTLAALRHGPRDYRFSGRALPVRPGQAVSLYRLTAGGGQVLTGRTTVRTDGGWSLRRRFTGSGRFPFVARTAGDLTNAAGTSNRRPTVIH